jgi:hypothetical protein
VDFRFSAGRAIQMMKPKGGEMRAVTGFATAMLALGLASSSAQTPAGLVLDRTVAIMERPGAPGPVGLAVEDLRTDFEKVLGTKPGVVPAARFNGPAVEITAPTGGPAESFSISVRGNHVVLSGADMRGTLYAIYTFSQEWLGVDPMYYWTDKEPAKRASIRIPANLNHAYPAPLFKYRGFFINDEDQLTGWANGEASGDRSGISKAVMDKIFETILRLRGNMVVPSTWAFPTDPQMKWVGERGLILNQHHAIPVGMNVARWPDGVPYNYSKNPDILERAWTNAVHSFDPHQEILWSVGLRGLSDVSYAAMDPSVVGNDKAQGELISKAIATQMRIVRAWQPNAQFVTDLWQEGARLMAAGPLTIPPEVGTVWADTGYGLEQDKGAVGKGQGMYYHDAMLNGRANQLSEMVPVARIHSEMGRFIKAGATNYVLLNTSDLRAVAMTAKAVMDTAWGGVRADGDAGHYREWATREYGAKAADAVAAIYRDYFAAIPKLASGDDYGDQLYHTEARQMLLSLMVDPPYYALPGQAPKWSAVRILGLPNPDGRAGFGMGPNYAGDTANRELKVTGDAQGKWDAVWKAALAAEPLVAPDRRDYFTYAIKTNIAMNRDGNRMLYLISRAVLAAKAGDRAKAKADARAALAAIAEVKALEKQSEYGKWKNWYRGEWLVGIDETRQMIQDFIAWLDDPLKTPYPVTGSGWMGYYHIMHYEGMKQTDVK